MNDTFAHPAFGLDRPTVAVRAGAAVLLGLIDPPAAIIPLIETGPGTDAPCPDLVQSLEARLRPPGTSPRKPARAG